MGQALARMTLSTINERRQVVGTELSFAKREIILIVGRRDRNMPASMNVLFVHNNFPASSAMLRVGGRPYCPWWRRSATATADWCEVACGLADADVSATRVCAALRSGTGDTRGSFTRCHRSPRPIQRRSDVAHCGWGETLPCERFSKIAAARLLRVLLRQRGRDVGFDDEFPMAGLDGGSPST